MVISDKIIREEVAAIVEKDEAEKMIKTLSKYSKKGYNVKYDILQPGEKIENPYYKFLLIRLKGDREL